MTFFFLVVGLEARREFDLGELRERRRLALPLVAGAGRDGRAGRDLPGRQRRAPVGARLGRGDVHRHRVRARACWPWSARGVPDRVRTFLLTVRASSTTWSALVVIAVVYSDHIDLAALLAGAGHPRRWCWSARWRGVRHGPVYLLLGVAAWVAFFESGVDPVVVGLAMGLLRYAYPAARGDLERAIEAFRLFREQPTPELARDAREQRAAGDLAERPAAAAVPPVDQLPDRAAVRPGERGHHGRRRASWPAPTPRRSRSGSCSATWSASRSGSSARPGCWPGLSRGRIRPPVGWAAVTGAGGHRRHRLHRVAADRLARLPRQPAGRGEGRHACPPRCARRLLGWAVFRLTALLPKRLRVRALLGTADAIIDLAVPVDPERDHVRGPDRGAGHAGGVRRLRVPLLRPGRAGRSASCWPTTVTSATSGGTCRSPTCTRTRSSPPRPPRPRPGRARSGRCTTCCWTHQDALTADGPDPVRRRARPGHRPVHRATCAATPGRPRSPRTWTPPT